MENLKIRVANKGDIKEAQELFFELGYEKGACSTGDYPALIIATPESRFQKTPYSSRATSLNHEAHSQYKEITLPELRDLVVLKRNNVGDATHTDGHYNFYVGKDKNYFFSSCDKAWRGTWKNAEILKPIEKKEMKEYLDPENNYRFNVTDKPFFDWIEIPDGANFAWKSDGKYVFFTALEMGYRDAAVVWSRHTHPEELPFVDDEPLQSLNDQYAEIEKVRQTLKTRQSQYGSFEDVATATQDLLKILEKTGLKSLPSMHKEALHMICSKMVRIVNGDHNFIESWHDIAGYATLMENELRVTDGATNSRLTYQKVINGKLQDI